MSTPADQFLQATVALIVAVHASERLKNPESEKALLLARKRYVELVSAFVAGWVTPEDST